MNQTQPKETTPESLAIMALVEEMRQIRELLEDMADNLDEIKQAQHGFAKDFLDFSIHGFGR